MRSLHLQGIRCFGGVQPRLAPLTILVGENSSGKSTFLALTRVAWDMAVGKPRANFNEDPFELGAYDDIARYHGGRSKRVTCFSIGASFAMELPERSEEVHFETTFSSEGGQPEVRQRGLRWGDLALTSKKTEGRIVLDVEAPSGRAAVALPPGWEGFLLDASRNLHGLLAAGAKLNVAVEGTPPKEPDLRRLASVSSAFFGTLQQMGRPYAFAPIRTRPRRTYDPLQSSPTPEGEHVPPTLARLHATKNGGWQEMAAELKRFGQASGMFAGVDVRHLGKEESDPFKILVRVEGQQASPPLIDVGYGVSQVLPILVDALRGPRFLLLQQPEVHLHPRAQGELGSFLGRLVVKGRQVLVETHSDYLLNRVCLEVRRGREDGLRPEHVLILYFERHEGEVRVHPIRLDAQGNLLGAPAGYRDFFIREELQTARIRQRRRQS